jgi:hypothetical protein
MEDALRRHCSLMATQIKATTIPDANKQSALWCIERLPALYTSLRETSQSRYGDEITRMVQAVVKELGQAKEPCRKAEKLAANIPERFKLFHEEWGLSALALKTPRAPAIRSPKAKKVRPVVS